MKKVYRIIQSMYNGKVFINEWDIVKETPKTVMVCYEKNNSSAHIRHDKQVFDKVNLTNKSDYTGLWQDAYVYVFAESEKEAVEKAVPIFREWIESLNIGLNQVLDGISKKGDNLSQSKESVKNTKIIYLYRDGCNYKQLNEEIVAGTFTKGQINTIMDCLDCGVYFIPSQVGFSEIRFDTFTEDDTCWFELERDGFCETKEPPTISMTPEEVVRKFLEAKNNWKETIIEVEQILAFMTGEAEGPDLEDPMLIDIAEYLITVDTDYGSCTQEFLEKFGLNRKGLEQYDDCYNYRSESERMIAEMLQYEENLPELASYKVIDRDNPFYGESRDIRYSELCDMYEEFLQKKEEFKKEIEGFEI